MVKFADIFEFQSKSGIKAGDGLDTGKYFFYTSSNEQKKFLNEHLFEGDALVFGTGGNPSVHFNDSEFSVSTDCLVAQPKDKKKVFAKFYYYFLRGNMRILEKGFKGAGLKHISKGYISAIELPKVDFDQQKKIVEILDRAVALRQKRKQSLQLLDDFLRATFLDMFGDPVSNSKNWKKVNLEEISDIQGGVQVSHKRGINPIEIPYLRVANVYRDRLVLDEIKTIKVTEPELRRTLLRKGDILIVEGHGNREEIGRTAVWDGSIDQCIHQNHLIRIRVDGKVAIPIYVSNYLNSDGGRRQLFAVGKTTSGLNTISSSNVKSLEIILPPIEIQQKYQLTVGEVQIIKQKMQTSLGEMDNKFSALTQRYFG